MNSGDDVGAVVVGGDSGGEVELLLLLFVE